MCGDGKTGERKADRDQRVLYMSYDPPYFLHLQSRLPRKPPRLFRNKIGYRGQVLLDVLGS
jgi:hypothetical protein